MTFHAKLGSQGARGERLAALARQLAPGVGASREEADRAAQLAKADLTSGMVGEFPELQGVMGGYYARHDGEDDAIADAVRDHYAPRGAADAVPKAPVSIAVALADKLNHLVAFFAVGETPTGSGDPFALRRAALGVIRILRENRLSIRLDAIVAAHVTTLQEQGLTVAADTGADVVGFIEDRLRVQLRGEGLRHDIVSAVLPRTAGSRSLDVLRDADRAQAIAAFLVSEAGVDLTTGYRRAANILAAEEKRDGHLPHGPADRAQFNATEARLAEALADARVEDDFANSRFTDAMQKLARLRAPLDAFFADVTVNDSNPALRTNRLRLLANVRAVMNQVADFSALEG